ncbi:MAG: SigB/SigF/SigG family RNA polymerase sigma factor [Actinomycetota bacterium]
MTATAIRRNPALTDGPVLSVEDDLALAWAADGPERKRRLDDVVVSQLGLARSVALRYRDRGQPTDDLVQVANLALVLAVQRYRPGQGLSFAAFAVPTIAGEVRRYFRDRSWDVRPPRRIQELRAAVHSASAELAQTLGRDATIGELATHLGIEREDVVETLTAMDGYRSASLDAPTTDSGTGTLADLMGGPDAALEQVVDIESVRPLIASLGERDRRILAMRFFDGCTQQEIADAIGVTQMQVSRLLGQVLATLGRQALVDA